MNRLDKIEQIGTQFQTWKSQRSADDFFDKIETNFLEKYIIYIIIDELEPSYLSISDDPSTQSFRTSRELYIYEMIEKLNIILDPKKKETPIIKIFDNNMQNCTINPSEFVFFYTKIKATNSKLKDLTPELIKRLSGNKELKKYTLETLNVYFFYTGDVNFDFTQYFDENTNIVVNQKRYKLRIIISYISKVSLFNHFARTNKLKVEYLDDKIVTLYELKRMSVRRRTKRADTCIQQVEPIIFKETKRRHSVEQDEIYKNKDLSILNVNRSTNIDEIKRQNILGKYNYGETIFGIGVFIGLTAGIPLLLRKIMN